VLDNFDLLGVKISVTNLAKACQAIEDWIKTGRRAYVCIVPVATIVNCQDDRQYREIVNGAGMNTPDGMPLVWLGRMKGYKEIDRTYGPDLMRKFCALSQDRGYRHYFYGGTPETNQLLLSKLRELFPRIDIVGSFAPPLRDIGEREELSVLTQINHARPDILWVGLGSPKQDYWMCHHREKLDVPVMVGVGAAFDFIAGVKKQAPRWMQRCGLEWFFRLCTEPRRLWRRYLVGNAKFIYWIVRDFFGKKG